MTVPVDSDAPRDSNRERILEAATDEFAEHGVAGARVDGIARAAGCNKQLIYHYFRDKNGLYDAVMQSALKARPPLDVRTTEDLALNVGRILAHAQCQRRWLRLLMWESLDVGEGAVHAEAVRVASSRHIAEEFARLQESDVVDKRLEPRFLALAFIALCIFPFVLPQMARMLTGEAPSSAGFQERYARVVSEIVRRLAPGR